MYSKRVYPTDRSVGSSVHESEGMKRTFVAQAISEIPELSHGIQDRRPRHSKHPSLLAMRAVFSYAFSITLVGRFPELTPVRSQATSRGSLPWMPVTQTDCPSGRTNGLSSTSVYLLLPNKTTGMNGSPSPLPSTMTAPTPPWE